MSEAPGGRRRGVGAPVAHGPWVRAAVEAAGQLEGLQRTMGASLTADGFFSFLFF